MVRLALLVIVGLLPHLTLAQGWMRELQVVRPDSVDDGYRAGHDEAERLIAVDSLRFVRTGISHQGLTDPFDSLGPVSRYFHQFLLSVYDVDLRVHNYWGCTVVNGGACYGPEPLRPGFVAGLNVAMAQEVERRYGAGVLAGLERSARVVADAEAAASDWAEWEVQERWTGVRVDGLRPSYAAPASAGPLPQHPVFVEVALEEAVCSGERAGSAVGAESHLYTERPGLVAVAVRVASGLTYVRTGPGERSRDRSGEYLRPYSDDCSVLVPILFVAAENG